MVFAAFGTCTRTIRGHPDSICSSACFTFCCSASSVLGWYQWIWRNGQGKVILFVLHFVILHLSVQVRNSRGDLNVFSKLFSDEDECCELAPVKSVLSGSYEANEGEKFVTLIFMKWNLKSVMFRENFSCGNTQSCACCGIVEVSLNFNSGAARACSYSINSHFVSFYMLLTSSFFKFRLENASYSKKVDETMDTAPTVECDVSTYSLDDHIPHIHDQFGYRKQQTPRELPRPLEKVVILRKSIMKSS